MNFQGIDNYVTTRDLPLVVNAAMNMVMKKLSYFLLLLTLLPCVHAGSIAPDTLGGTNRVEITHDLHFSPQQPTLESTDLPSLLRRISDKRKEGWCQVESVIISSEFDPPWVSRALTDSRLTALIDELVLYGFPRERIHSEIKQRNEITSLLRNSNTIHLEFFGYSNCTNPTNPKFNQVTVPGKPAK